MERTASLLTVGSWVYVYPLRRENREMGRGRGKGRFWVVEKVGTVNE